jgi:diguanylate cyclase (GGDEF)-like protein/PAS domain S-box-containing protein
VAPQHPIRILLVEDNPGDARLIHELLINESSTPFNLTTVGTLDQANFRLSQEHFEVILLDLSLPDSQGVETVQSIVRALPTNSPIIVLTGLNDEETALNAVRIGAQDYLIKGEVSAPLLSRAIQHAIERQRQEAAAKLYWQVFETISEGVVITDISGRIVRVNPAFTQITGFTETEAVGAYPSILRSGKHDPLFYQDFWSRLIRTGHWAGEIWNRRKNGEIYPQWMTVNAVQNIGGVTTHFVGIFNDITQRKQIEESLYYRATHDPLTGLPNREYLGGQLAHAIAQSKRNRQTLAVLLLDLDGFKLINDNLGHAFGDLVLQEISQRLQANIRKSDIIARLGGDEFVVAIEAAPDHDACRRVASNLIQILSEPIQLSDIHCTVGASIGISLCPYHATDGASLLQYADIALYQAKEQRGTYRFYEPEWNDARLTRYSAD